MNTITKVDWSADVFRILKDWDVGTVATVPDAGLSGLLGLCGDDPEMRVVTLTTEEEGIGLVVGQWLGGGRALLAMQSSGAGNCINGLGLPAILQAPCPMLITMRGQEREANPWQVPMGRAVRPVFEAMGVSCFEAMEAGDVGPLFARAAELAYGSRQAAAVLVSQRVIGFKAFE
ncbi:MAG: phosphonopyruvate decarboxylase [Hyphomicrobiales bacterium]|nr:phosphonopyruvate decarboxylase [Hyphomicrobiales bacterium]